MKSVSHSVCHENCPQAGPTGGTFARTRIETEKRLQIEKSQTQVGHARDFISLVSLGIA